MPATDMHPPTVYHAAWYVDLTHLMAEDDGPVHDATAQLDVALGGGAWDAVVRCEGLVVCDRSLLLDGRRKATYIASVMATTPVPADAVDAVTHAMGPGVEYRHEVIDWPVVVVGRDDIRVPLEDSELPRLSYRSLVQDAAGQAWLQRILARAGLESTRTVCLLGVQIPLKVGCRVDRHCNCPRCNL